MYIEIQIDTYTNLNYIYLKFFVEFSLRGYLFTTLSSLRGKEM